MASRWQKMCRNLASALAGGVRWVVIPLYAAGPGRRYICQLPLEQPALGIVVGERQRTLVGQAGLGDAAQPAKQLSPGRVQVAIVLQLQPVHDLQSGLRA